MVQHTNKFDGRTRESMKQSDDRRMMSTGKKRGDIVRVNGR